MWGFTESAQGGTRNPRDPERDPGGSTGGGAAAVAAGLVALALGTDGGVDPRPGGHCGSSASSRPASFRCPAAPTSTGSG